MSTIPFSKTSSSGLIPFSFMIFAKLTIVSSVFTNISSPPKLHVPQSRVANSGVGTTSVDASLSRSVIPTAPPVEG